MNKKHEDLIDNRYRKFQKLGEGGYGRVTKCSLVAKENDKNTQDKFYAVKKYFLQRVIKYIKKKFYQQNYFLKQRNPNET